MLPFEKTWEDWCLSWVPTKCKMPKPLSMFLFAGIAWTLWNTRNKMAIEDTFPNNGVQPLFVGLGFLQRFLQRWTPLLKAADHDKIRELVEGLKTWATNTLASFSFLMLFCERLLLLSCCKRVSPVLFCLFLHYVLLLLSIKAEFLL